MGSTKYGFSGRKSSNIVLKNDVKKRSIFYPDRSHFHYKLLDLGLSHRNAVLIIYSMILWSVCFALLFTNLPYKNLLFLISNIIFLALIYTKFKLKINLKKKLNK